MLLICAAVLMLLKKSPDASIATIGVLCMFTLQDGSGAIKKGWKSKNFLKFLLIAVSLALTISSFKFGDNFFKSISVSAMFLGYMFLDIKRKGGGQRDLMHSILILILFFKFFVKIVSYTHPNLNLFDTINILTAILFVGFAAAIFHMLIKKKNISQPKQ